MNDPSFALICPWIPFVVVFLTSLWVLSDASVNEIPTDGVDYRKGGGAFTWFLASLLFWIIIFPWYLYRRYSVLQIRAEQRVQESSYSLREKREEEQRIAFQKRIQQLEIDRTALLNLLVRKGVLTQTELAQLVKASAWDDLEEAEEIIAEAEVIDEPKTGIRKMDR